MVVPTCSDVYYCYQGMLARERAHFCSLLLLSRMYAGEVTNLKHRLSRSCNDSLVLCFCIPFEQGLLNQTAYSMNLSDDMNDDHHSPLPRGNSLRRVPANLHAPFVFEDDIEASPVRRQSPYRSHASPSSLKKPPPSPSNGSLKPPPPSYGNLKPPPAGTSPYSKRPSPRTSPYAGSTLKPPPPGSPYTTNLKPPPPSSPAYSIQKAPPLASSSSPYTSPYTKSRSDRHKLLGSPRHSSSSTEPSERDETNHESTTTTTAVVEPFNNEFIKDVQETGKWGELSKKEVVLVVGLVSMFFVVVVIVLVVLAFTTGGLGSSSSGDQQNSPPVGNGVSPTSAPTVVPSIDEKYQYLLQALRRKQATAGWVDHMPSRPDDLLVSFATYSNNNNNNNSNNDTQHLATVLRAAEWVLYQDQGQAAGPNLVHRFVLAALFWANGGQHWEDSTNWLSHRTVCEWEGVSCRPHQRSDSTFFFLQEIDLTSNHLTGRIPAVLALLDDLRVLWLKDNALTGPIPGEVFGAMDSLSILYLQENALTGTVPASLRDNGVLGKNKKHCVCALCAYVRHQVYHVIGISSGSLNHCSVLLSLGRVRVRVFIYIIETLFVHGNNLTGSWPGQFCKTCQTCPGLLNFGLNCQKITCDPSCCSLLENCFA